jgi:hypothetical protein
MFTRACHFSQINPVHVPYISSESILIIFSYLCLDLPSGLFSSSFPVNPCMHSSLHPYVHTPHLSHHPWFDHASSFWWGVQIIKLFTQFSPVSCYFLPLRSKYLPQYPILEYLQSVLPLMWQPKFKYFMTNLHTHVQQQAKLVTWISVFTILCNKWLDRRLS